ncbi:hypothetical protein AHAS_Ahas13G0412100 [Arachis hypogaea]
MPQILLKERGVFENADTGGVWLTSARAVRCWVKFRNERNPQNGTTSSTPSELLPHCFCSRPSHYPTLFSFITSSPPPSPHHPHHPHHPHPLSPTSAPLHSPAYPPHHQHHHHHSPAPAPVAHHHLPPTPTPTPLHPPHYTPTPAPAHPPVHSPAPVPHPPVSPVPRSFVAVQGVVYVKSCKYASVDTLLGALPLLDATVKLQCNNTRYKLVQTAKTDKNGYFFLEAPKSITTYGAHKCNVVLVSAPNGLKPSNLHGDDIEFINDKNNKRSPKIERRLEVQQRHMEKHNHVLTEAYRSMLHQAPKLQVEEEMLMHKLYGVMAAHGLVKKNDDNSNNPYNSRTAQHSNREVNVAQEEQ